MASIQDQQQEDDIKAQHLVVAPSLHRHKMRIIPEDLQVNPSSPNNITDTELDADIIAEGEGETKVDEWFDEKVLESSSDGDNNAIEYKDGDDEDAGGVQVKSQRHQRKKRGDSLPALIEAMRKHPCPVGGNLKKSDVSLVTKVPPIPASKGKKSHGM